MADEEEEEAAYEESMILAHWEIPDNILLTDDQAARLNPAGHVVLPKLLCSRIASCAQESDRAYMNWIALAQELKPYFPGRAEFVADKPRFIEICLLGYSDKDCEIYRTKFGPDRRE